MTAAILLFDDVEVLDFAGPFEVFSVAADVLVRWLREAHEGAALWGRDVARAAADYMEYDWAGS